MKRLILSLFVALCCCSVAFAIPAYRGLIKYTQPDGSVIMIRMHGDEFCHWVTDDSGNVIELDDEGYYRPASASQLRARRAAGNIRRQAMNEARKNAALRSGGAIGQKHYLVILVEFSDVHFSYSKSDFEALLNAENYTVNGGTGSARKFYMENSHNAFEPIFDVYGPVTLDNNQAYYGGNKNNVQGNDQRPRNAVSEGCQKINSQFDVDFSQYDGDGDGYVDLVFMYYAGKGEADGGGANCIWPHQWNLASALTLDGTKVYTYACTNEIVSYGELTNKLCGIGTACHEFGHAMGLPDFYDTDYDDYNGEAGGLYDYSTMCGGSYNNDGRTPPYFNMEERIMLGWLEESAITTISSSGNYTLTSVNNNVAYKTPTETEGEYFLYECRSKTGWDIGIPEDGLIVYHVDKSSRLVTIMGSSENIQVEASELWSNWGTYNSINENGEHPCFYVVPAGGQSNLNYSGSKFAFPGGAKKYSFTGYSWNGVESDVKLTNISYSNNTVSFYAEAPSVELNYNVIDNPGNGVYAAGDVFTLSLVESAAQPVTSVVWYFDDEPVSGPSVVLTAGTHVIEAHMTLSSGGTKILELTVVAQ